MGSFVTFLTHFILPLLGLPTLFLIWWTWYLYGRKKTPKLAIKLFLPLYTDAAAAKIQAFRGITGVFVLFFILLYASGQSSQLWTIYWSSYFIALLGVLISDKV
jgi:hypothetical protein